MKLSKFCLCLVAVHSFLNAQSFVETIYPDWQQAFSINKVLYQEQTDYQDLILFENETFGTVLALDGIIQITEKDEFIYQEMLAHVAMFSHQAPKSVMIIGGGDGGVLREVLRHQSVSKVVLVELDDQVVKFSKKHLPFVSQGAFEDDRVSIVFQDGCKYVKTTEDKFDVIIVDSPDPVGEGLNLFTPEFYKNCHDCLNPKGVFVNQSGVPFLQEDELLIVNDGLKKSFKAVKFYFVAVPTYVGGLMAMGFASDGDLDDSLEAINQRYTSYASDLRYYTPAVHQAAFAAPKFIEDLLKK